MNPEKFYPMILSNHNTCLWISAYVSLFKEGSWEMLEQVRSGLVNDMYEYQVHESVIESIRAYINA